MSQHGLYPYLPHLLGAYFHQDAFEDNATFESIVEDYKQTTHAYEQQGLRADIQQFLHKTFSPDVIIGASDAEARAWLAQVLALLDN